MNKSMDNFIMQFKQHYGHVPFHIAHLTVLPVQESILLSRALFEPAGLFWLKQAE